MSRNIDQETLDRETECLRLRRGGLTLDEIAKRVGYANPGSVHKALERANARIVREDVEEIRNLEAERLDLLQAANWGRALAGDIPAGALVLRVMERRAKLLGLDMPIRVQQEVTVWNGDGDLDGEIQSLISRLAGLDGSTNVLAIEQGETGTTTS
jgi:hypothetical protein